MKLKKIFLLVMAALAQLIVFSCASAPDSPVAVVYKNSEPGIPASNTAVIGAIWTFEDPEEGTEGWYLEHDEFYRYNGPAVLSWDDTVFGNGMLRLDVDFTADRNSEWSEPKMKNIFPEPLVLSGVTQFSFDCYMNPSLYTNGQLKAKISSDKGVHIEAVCDMIDARDDAGRGYLKAKVIMPLGSAVNGAMEEMYFSIAGYLFNYRGPLFFDNLRLE